MGCCGWKHHQLLPSRRRAAGHINHKTPACQCHTHPTSGHSMTISCCPHNHGLSAFQPTTYPQGSTSSMPPLSPQHADKGPFPALLAQLLHHIWAQTHIRPLLRLLLLLFARLAGSTFDSSTWLAAAVLAAGARLLMLSPLLATSWCCILLVVSRCW